MINTLNNSYFRPMFRAVFHTKEKLIEVIYDYLDPIEYKDIINRKFDVHFEGNRFTCYFSEPTKAFLQIAKHSERIPSESFSPLGNQLRKFKDAQDLSNSPPFVKNFFKDKVPRNFFIQASKDLKKIDVERLAEHLNFLMHYYDRETPIIDIQREHDKTSMQEGLRYLEKDSMPTSLLANSLDDVMLQLIAVARPAPARFAFIYYYQALEFAAFHYIDKEIKSKIRNLLRDPSFINCNDENFSKFYYLLTDGNHQDDVKMKKLIQDYCDPNVVWKEIEHNKPFFCAPHEFEGGFTIDSLIASTTDQASWCSMWMPKLLDQITKIRNGLVHARERRERNSILPTKKNHDLLSQYVPIISRVAEQITLKAE